MAAKILLVDDDMDLSLVLSDMLESYGYEVEKVYNGEEAYEILKNRVFDVIVLDINLPDESGFDICRNIRKVSGIPIVFASARSSEDDKVTGLDIGADDYVPKPYSLKEMLSRVNALLRRSKGFSRNEEIHIGLLKINSDDRRVYRGNTEINLALKEFDLLLYMALHKNTILRKEELLQEVWGTFSEAEISTVSVHIRWLREKIESNPGKPQYIRTSWGTGYGLFEPEKEVTEA